MPVPDRLRKGDKIVTTAPVFAARAQGLIPAGTTGIVSRGGRWHAQVTFNHPNVDGGATTDASILPRPGGRIARQEA